jgi:hypothetical protein
MGIPLNMTPEDETTIVAVHRLRVVIRRPEATRTSYCKAKREETQCLSTVPDFVNFGCDTELNTCSQRVILKALPFANDSLTAVTAQ